MQTGLVTSAADGVHLTVLGEFLNYRFRSASGGFCVLRLKVRDVTCSDSVACPGTLFSDLPPDDLPSTGSVITATGVLPDLSLDAGTELVVSGRWAESKYGYQLQIRSLTISDPSDTRGILEYLSSGVIRGIGSGLARRIVEHFGNDTLRILDEDPTRLIEVRGIGKKSLDSIVSSWNNQRLMAKLLMSVCALGLSVTYARKVLEAFGQDAPQMISQDPYVLTEIDGIGFLKADRIARGLGIPEDSPSRIKAAILYCLQEASYSEGHCYLPEEDLLSRVVSLTGLDEDKIMGTATSGSGKDFICAARRFYLPRIYRAEQFVSEKLFRMANSVPSSIPDIPPSPFLADEQNAAVKSIFSSPLSVITGGPGTGKTTTVRYLISVLENLGISYCLAAPTGKAAKRLAEVTDRETVTLHRLLEYRDGRFMKNEDDPLRLRFIIVDESSMIDILLMEALLRAIPDGTSLVLVGDADQLPSVGPGNLLRDIIQQRPTICSRLRRIHRQVEGSAIVNAAHMINRGEGIRRVINSADLMFIEGDSPDEIVNTVVSLVREHPDFRPEDIQVLSPVKKGDLGVGNLNTVIRGALKEYNLSYALKLSRDRGITPRWLECEVSPEDIEKLFGIGPGDRVIQVKNNYDKEVFNGEVGYIIDADPDERTLCVLYDGCRPVFYKDTELDQLQLAYALTVHKSQGSEFPMVVLVMHTTHYVMLYRNLLYTAATRAKDTLVITGTMKAVDIAVRNNKLLKRYTNLQICQQVI